MSNTTNQQLLDRAADMVEYWEGTLHAELIKMALDSGDLELVRKYVAEAEAEVARQEMNGYNVLPEKGGVY